MEDVRIADAGIMRVFVFCDIIKAVQSYERIYVCSTIVLLLHMQQEDDQDLF